MKLKTNSPNNIIIPYSMKVKNKISKDKFAIIAPSIYKGYLLYLDYTDDEPDSVMDVLLVPESCLVLSAEGVMINLDINSDNNYYHMLGTYSVSRRLPKKASVDDHSHCNPLLFIETQPSGLLYKAEICNFAYQLERLKQDNLELKEGLDIRHRLQEVGSYFYIDQFNRINFYVSKEPSVFKGYNLAKAVHFAIKQNIISPTPSYKLVKNVIGAHNAPIDVSPLGFIFSFNYFSDDGYRNMMHAKLSLKPENIGSLKAIFWDTYKQLGLKFSSEAESYMQLTKI